MANKKYASPDCRMCKGSGQHSDPAGGNFMVNCSCVTQNLREAAIQRRQQAAQERVDAERERQYEAAMAEADSEAADDDMLRMLFPHSHEEVKAERIAKAKELDDDPVPAGYRDTAPAFDEAMDEQYPTQPPKASPSASRSPVHEGSVQTATKVEWPAKSSLVLGLLVVTMILFAIGQIPRAGNSNTPNTYAPRVEAQQADQPVESVSGGRTDTTSPITELRVGDCLTKDLSRQGDDLMLGTCDLGVPYVTAILPVTASSYPTMDEFGELTKSCPPDADGYGSIWPKAEVWDADWHNLICTANAAQ